MKIKGTREEVYDGEAYSTGYGSKGLTRADLKLNAKGKIVSKKAAARGKQLAAHGGGIVAGSLNIGKGVARAAKRANARESIEAAKHREFLLQMAGAGLVGGALDSDEGELGDIEEGGRLNRGFPTGKGVARAAKRANARAAIASTNHRKFMLQLAGGELSAGEIKRGALYHLAR